MTINIGLQNITHSNTQSYKRAQIHKDTKRANTLTTTEETLNEF